MTATETIHNSAKQDQLAAINDVPDGSRRQGKNEERERRRRLRERHIGRTGVERDHQPRRTDALHERTYVRGHVRDEQIAENCRS